MTSMEEAFAKAGIKSGSDILRAAGTVSQKEAASIKLAPEWCNNEPRIFIEVTRRLKDGFYATFRKELSLMECTRGNDLSKILIDQALAEIGHYK